MAFVNNSEAGSLDPHRMADFRAFDHEDVEDWDLGDRPAPQPLFRREPQPEVPWEQPLGIMRLTREALPEEGPPPPDWCVPPVHGRQAITNLRNHLQASEIPEALADERLRLLAGHQDRFEILQAWQTLDPDGELGEWSETLHNHPGIDARCLEDLATLVELPGNLGAYEANRVLFHLLKDTASASSDNPRLGPWLHRVVNESLESIRNWQDWDCDRMRASGKTWTWYLGNRQIKKYYWASGPQHPGPSNSSRPSDNPGGGRRWAQAPEGNPWASMTS